MKRLATLFIIVSLSLFCYSQTEHIIRQDTIEHIAKGNDTKLYHTDTRYEFKTNKDTFNFNKIITVNGISVAGAFQQPFDSLVLNPNVNNSYATNYKMFANNDLKVLSYYRPGADFLVHFGEDDISPVINRTSDTILKGQPISADTADLINGVLTINRAYADTLEQASFFIGLAEQDIYPDSLGIALRYGAIFYNTSNWDEKDLIYVCADTCDLTNIRPPAPAYPLLVGSVLIKGNPGVLGINAVPFTRTDTEVNLDGILNGVITKTQAIRDTIIGGLLYFETYNESDPTKDLPFMYKGDRCKLNTTTNSGTNGYARVQLTYGTLTNPQTNYIYIDNSGLVPVLAANTTGFPAIGVRLAEVAVLNETGHNNYGFVKIQRFNNSVDGSEAEGWVSRAAKRLRLDGSKYDYGVDPTVTIVTSAGLDSLQVSTTSGVIWQFNSQIFPAQDGHKYLWINNPNAAGGYTWITDLNQIGVDANNVTLRNNNTRYGLNLFFVQNSGSYGGYIAVATPSGSYGSDVNAINDIYNYAITSLPSELSKVGVRGLRIVVNYSTASGGIFTNLLGAGEFQDERGFPLGTAGGGSGSGSAITNFSDANFTIYNSADPTRIMDFDASEITTGTTRTLTIPDNSGVIGIVAGSNKEVQYNDNGVLGSSSNFTWNDTALSIETGIHNIYIIDSLHTPLSATGEKNTIVSSSNNGHYITTGDFNSFFGFTSGENTTTGNGNSFFGVSSGQINESGNYNSYFGFGSNFFNTGSNNIGLGAYSGFNISGLSNRLIINSIARSTVSNDTTQAIIFGFQNSTVSNQKLYLNANVDISESLTLNGSPVLTSSQSLPEAINEIRDVRSYSGSVSNYISGDYVVISTNTTGATYLLPAASGNAGVELILKKYAASGTLTVDGNASETIDGATTLVVNFGEAYTIICDGTEWFIISKY